MSKTSTANTTLTPNPWKETPIGTVVRSSPMTTEEVEWWRKQFEPYTLGGLTPTGKDELAALAERVKKLEDEVPKMVEMFLKVIEDLKNDSK